MMIEVSSDIDPKLKRLSERLTSMGSVIVALSGGVDSAVLLLLATRVLGESVEAATVSSPLTPARDLAQARELAAQAGVVWHRIEADERIEAGIEHNPEDRCFLCKKFRFGRLVELAAERGLNGVVDGSNADDDPEGRPGMRAAEELGVVGPLRRAGLTKREVRLVARGLGLSLADKPPSACLATRLPHGRRLDTNELALIDRAEDIIHDLGFGLVRVRISGKEARLELDPAQISKMADGVMADEVVGRLRDLGFERVYLDLEGYRGQID